MDHSTKDVTYTFEILGGLGEKPYVPVVVFVVRDEATAKRASMMSDDGSAPAGPKKKISVDMSLCIITPRPDLVTSVSQTATTSFGSAVELCVTKEEKQVPAAFHSHTRSHISTCFFHYAETPSLTASSFVPSDCPIYGVFQV